MRRTDKYPDTDTFHYFNANPHNRINGDCVIRAIATATGKTWEHIVRELTEIGLKHGLICNDVKCYEIYLAQEGWIKHPQPRKADNTKFTGQEFCRLLQARRDNFPVIAHIGGHHIVAIIEGRVWDTWDSTCGCIGNYWN